MVRLSVACCCIMAAVVVGTASEGIRKSPPVLEFFHALSEEPALPSILSEDSPSPLECKTKLFEDREVVDFEKREIYFERVDKTFGIVVWQYRYDELDAYLESRRHFVLLNAWYKSALSLLTVPAEKKKNPFTALQWELPVQYPAWAQRILGKDPPKLSISGFEKITVSYNYTKTDIPGSEVQIQPSNAVVFDQDNQFSITGSVGRLIGINIKGSTKQATSMDVQNNPLKNFKIEYKGEGDELEDEVIQQVTAGFTSFDMPSTVLSGYSESHEGLFGVKVVSKLGPLSLTGIASTEQGESQNTTLHPSGAGDAGTVRSEKDFLRNKIFFLDTVYRNAYIVHAQQPGRLCAEGGDAPGVGVEGQHPGGGGVVKCKQTDRRGVQDRSARRPPTTSTSRQTTTILLIKITAIYGSTAFPLTTTTCSEFIWSPRTARRPRRYRRRARDYLDPPR